MATSFKPDWATYYKASSRLVRSSEQDAISKRGQEREAIRTYWGNFIVVMVPLASVHAQTHQIVLIKLCAILCMFAIPHFKKTS